MMRQEPPEYRYSYRNFPLEYENFPQTHLCSLECSYSSPIRRCVRRTEAYPILKTFLLFFKLRRFGGVGAPEGLENVPDILTQKFPQSKCFWLFIMARQHQNFPQDQNCTKCFRKIQQIGAANLRLSHGRGGLVRASPTSRSPLR